MKEFSYAFSINLPIENVCRHIIFEKVSEKTPKRLRILQVLNELSPESGVISLEFFAKEENLTNIIVCFSSVKKMLWFQTQMETLSTEE